MQPICSVCGPVWFAVLHNFLGLSQTVWWLYYIIIYKTNKVTINAAMSCRYWKVHIIIRSSLIFYYGSISTYILVRSSNAYAILNHLYKILYNERVATLIYLTPASATIPLPLSICVLINKVLSRFKINECLTNLIPLLHVKMQVVR